MKNYEMMVLDLDGTLLNSDSRLEANTKLVLQNCMKKGKKIVLCSSRSYEEMSVIVNELYEGCEQQYCIGFGGALGYTRHGKCVVRSDSIEASAAKKIIQLAEDGGIHIHGYDENVLYYYQETEALKIFLNFAKVTHIHRRKITYEEFIHKTFMKLMCLGEMKKLEEYDREVSLVAGTSFSNPAGQQGYLDILQSGISKGSGVEQLCHYLRIPVEQCICVGDGDNDIPMLRKAGLGIAMKNGTEGAKAAADYVLPYSNDENAIMYVVKTFLG